MQLPKFPIPYIFIFAFGFLISSLLVVNGDVFFYLAIGDFFMTNGYLPLTDPYSFQTEGLATKIISWLTCVVYYVIYNYSSYTGLGIFRSLIIATTLVFLLKYINQYCKDQQIKLDWWEGILYFIFLCFIVFIGWSTRFFVRPELFGLLGTVLLLYYLPKIFKDKSPKTWLKSKAYYVLVIGIILWTNLHLSFAVGLGIIAIYMFIEGLKKSIYFKDLYFWLAGLILPISVCINPNGLSHYTLLIDLFFGVDANYVIEMRPLYQDISIFSYQTGFVILSAIVILYSIYKKRFFEAVILLIHLFMALKANRFFPLLAIVFISIGSQAFLDLRQRIKQQTQAIQYVTYSAVFLIVLGLGLFSYKKLSWAKFGFGFDYNVFSEEVGDFILDNQLEGKMFNNFYWGSYLIWKLYPDYQVFIDTRSQVYGGELLDNYYYLVQEPQRWEVLNKKYNFQFAVLRYPEIAHGKEVNNWIPLFPKNKWGLAYFDQSGFILVRRDGPNGKFADTYQYINPFAKNDVTYLNYFIQQGQGEAVIEELNKALEIKPDNTVAHFQLAYLYSQKLAYLSSNKQPVDKERQKITYHLNKIKEIDPTSVSKELLERFK